MKDKPITEKQYLFLVKHSEYSRKAIRRLDRDQASRIIQRITDQWNNREEFADA